MAQLPARPNDECNEKQLAFVEHLCELIEENVGDDQYADEDGNITFTPEGKPIVRKQRMSMSRLRIEAAKRAGYDSSDKYASTESMRMLQLPKVQEAITQWWATHKTPYALAGMVRMGNIVMSTGSKDADAIKAAEAFMDRDEKMTKRAGKLEVDHKNIPLSRDARIAELQSLMQVIGVKAANVIEGSFKEVETNPLALPRYEQHPELPGRVIAPDLETWEADRSTMKGDHRVLKPQRTDRARRGRPPLPADELRPSQANIRDRIDALCEDI